MRRPRSYEPIGLSHIGTVLAEAIGDERRVREALGVWPAWEEAVGPQIAAAAKPVALRDGVLLVHVKHPVWMQELLTMKALLLRKIHKKAPAGVVKDLRFRVAPLPEALQDPTIEKPVPPPPAPIPYALARTIRDQAPPKLRNVLLRVAARWAAVDKAAKVSAERSHQ